MKLSTGGYLAFYMPQRKGAVEIAVEVPTPLKDILRGLQIPLAEVHLVAINGIQADIEAVVNDSDSVRVFSSVDGG